MNDQEERVGWLLRHLVAGVGLVTVVSFAVESTTNVAIGIVLKALFGGAGAVAAGGGYALVTASWALRLVESDCTNVAADER